MIHFKYGFEEAFIAKLIERMEDNQNIFEKILNDQEFGEAVKKWMLNKVYEKINVTKSDQQRKMVLKN